MTNLLRGRLPPVGQPASAQSAAQNSGASSNLRADPAWALDGYRCITLASGTAALALALRILRDRHPRIARPEVLLPGYACPDLLAAAHWAGVMPVLVDLSTNDHALDLNDAAARCTPATIALVAVNLLGIADRLEQLQAFCRARAISLVEDDAQWLPEPWSPQTLIGDCVILSFGRGKPMPLVGGGALLLRDTLASAATMANAMTLVTAVAKPRLPISFAVAAYHLALNRYIYAGLAALPFLHVGATRYKPLNEVAAMDSAREHLLQANLAQHHARDRSREQWLREWLVPACPPGTIDLADRHAERAGRLLRFPLLLPNQPLRDRLFAKLDAAGLGASKFYARVLPEVDSVPAQVPAQVPAHVPAKVDWPPLPNARDFAARLLTLPIHPRVTMADVKRMAAVAATVR